MAPSCASAGGDRRRQRRVVPDHFHSSGLLGFLRGSRRFDRSGPQRSGSVRSAGGLGGWYRGRRRASPFVTPTTSRRRGTSGSPTDFKGARDLPALRQLHQGLPEHQREGQQCGLDVAPRQMLLVRATSVPVTGIALEDRNPLEREGQQAGSSATSTASRPTCSGTRSARPGRGSRHRSGGLSE